MATRKANGNKGLTPALAKRVAKEVARKQRDVRAQAQEDLGVVRRLRTQITDAFYEIGEALVRLKDSAKALGYASFGALCEQELEMSLGKAEQLIALVSRLRRTDAVRLGQDRAVALLELCDATPEDDTPGELEHATIDLPDGSKLHIPKASARQIKAAAKAIRASRPSKSARGRTTTAAERAFAQKLLDALRAHGVEGATVEARATKPGKPATLSIERVPIAALPVLRRLLPAK